MKPYYQDEVTTIYHADCEEVMPTLSQFDLLLTDPPYGIAENSKKQKSRGTRRIPPTDFGYNDWDIAPPSKELIDKIRALATHQIIFGGNYFELPPSSCWLVWDKQTNGDFADCELAWTNFDKAVRRITYMWNGMVKKHPEKRFHPTQKPLAVIAWAIGHAPSTARTIFDPFMGSGTTLRAAKDLGIVSVGIDKDERYCEFAAKRMQQSSLFETETPASIQIKAFAQSLFE